VIEIVKYHREPLAVRKPEEAREEIAQDLNRVLRRRTYWRPMNVALRRLASRSSPSMTSPSAGSLNAITTMHGTEFERGGHFAAIEMPDLLVGDMREFFRRFR
jgi:hypothetical protein